MNGAINANLCQVLTTRIIGRVIRTGITAIRIFSEDGNENVRASGPRETSLRRRSTLCVSIGDHETLLAKSSAY